MRWNWFSAWDGKKPPPKTSIMAHNGPLTVPEIVAPYTAQVEPSFEGVGDTMGFGLNDEGYFGMPTCAYCGSSGAHKPDCATLASNYPAVSSLQRQRAKTAELRGEGQAPVRDFGTWSPTTTRAPASDTRSELQKRFDEIAAELAETKDD